MNKIVIVVLILIVAVFVVFVGVGSFKSEPKKDPKDVEAPPGSETFSRLFGGLQEKVVLDCALKSPPNSNRQCEKLPSGEINIPAAKEPSIPFLKKTAFRTAKLILISGQASITYLDRKGGGKNFDNPQVISLPNPDNKNSRVESIVIREQGGILTVSCKGNGSCQVGQQ
jgi:hypothetical protein